jgi:hypothetical protein
VRCKRRDDFHRVDLAVAPWDRDRRDPGRPRPMVGLDDKNRASVTRQDSRIRRQPPIRVDDHAGGVIAGNRADRQLRIVGDDGADPDDHRIDQCPEPVQMQDRLGTIDVTGIACRCSDTPIERLAKLADDERLVAMSGGDGLVQAPECMACVRIRRTDDVMARSKP